MYSEQPEGRQLLVEQQGLVWQQVHDPLAGVIYMALDGPAVYLARPYMDGFRWTRSEGGRKTHEGWSRYLEWVPRKAPRTLERV